MKNLLFITQLICLTSFGQLGTLAELDKRNGFQDIKLGKPIPPTIKVTKDDEDKKYYFYNVISKKYKIGNIETNTVSIWVDKKTNLVNDVVIGIPFQEKILQSLQELYGLPIDTFQITATKLQHDWKGQKVSLAYQNDNNETIWLMYIRKEQYKDETKEDL